MLIEHLRKSIDEKRVAGKHAVARRSEFCLRKLCEYVGEGDVALCDITPQWLDGFQTWLTQEQSLKDNTTSSYMRTVLSVCRAAAKAGKTVDLTAFDDCFTGVASSTRARLDASDYKKLKALSLTGSALFAKTRDMLLVSVLCCGMDSRSIVALRKSDIRNGFVRVRTQDGTRKVPVCDEAWTILQRYGESQGDYFFCNSDTVLSANDIAARCREYERRLDAIRRIANMDKAISADSASELWASVAVTCGVAPAVVNVATGREMSRVVKPEDMASVTEQDILSATTAVSAALNPRSVHWFAMKCIERTRDEVAQEFADNMPGIDIFVPEAQSNDDTKGRRVKSALDVIERTLFFRCHMADAIALKKPWRSGVYIYDYLSAEGRMPAIIPEADMKMFMYINEVDPSKILYFFPEEATAVADFSMMEEVFVTDGKWKGAKGKYMGPYKDSKIMVSVAVEFPNLGIVATAPIEKRFICHCTATEPATNKQKSDKKI